MRLFVATELVKLVRLCFEFFVNLAITSSSRLEQQLNRQYLRVVFIRLFGDASLTSADFCRALTEATGTNVHKRHRWHGLSWH